MTFEKKQDGSYSACILVSGRQTYSYETWIRGHHIHFTDNMMKSWGYFTYHEADDFLDICSGTFILLLDEEEELCTYR